MIELILSQLFIALLLLTLTVIISLILLNFGMAGYREQQRSRRYDDRKS